MMIWYDHSSGWGWWGWLLMAAVMLVFWVIVVWGVVGLVRNSTPTPPDPSGPEQLLAERFARGEIDEAEYNQRLQTLRPNRTPVGRR